MLDATVTSDAPIAIHFAAPSTISGDMEEVGVGVTPHDSKPFDLRRTRVHCVAKWSLRLAGEACDLGPKPHHQLDQTPVRPAAFGWLEEKDADLVRLAEFPLGLGAVDVRILS